MDYFSFGFLLAFLGILNPGGAAADALTGDQIDRIDTHFAAAIAEQRVVLTCSATMDEASTTILKRNWRETVSETIDQLASSGYPETRLSAMRTQTLVENVVVSADTPWSDVVSMCSANQTWLRKVMKMDFVKLPELVRDVIDPK